MRILLCVTVPKYLPKIEVRFGEMAPISLWKATYLFNANFFPIINTSDISSSLCHLFPAVVGFHIYFGRYVI